MLCVCVCMCACVGVCARVCVDWRPINHASLICSAGMRNKQVPQMAEWMKRRMEMDDLIQVYLETESQLPLLCRF